MTTIGTPGDRRTTPGQRVPPAASAGPRYTPVELARLLGLRLPTPEQVEIISAPLTSLLVVAGAGSGKTETMAARVVWLVANGYVRPEQILGLTFTRKAAGELAHRVRARLSQLVRRLGRDDLITGEPTVATYHSYAARIVTEHGLRAGYEPTNRLLTEASCWQLADAVVRGYDGDMSEVGSAPSTVTDAVLHLAGDLAEHLVDPDTLAGWTGRFHAEVSAAPGRVYRDVAAALQRQRARLQLLPLVRAFAARKRDLEAMDFGDQLARAARVARDHPEVGAVERDRYRAVLLDEYQDTSHAQVVLLRALYGGGHPVTAVGDPCQSIYGWRGASAGTLDRFREEFTQRDGSPAVRLQLSTSWRNRPEILQVANALSEPLRAFGHQVARLHAAPSLAGGAGPAEEGRPAPVGQASPAGERGLGPVAQASPAVVRCALLPTFADEAEWIADRIVAAWRHAAGSRARPAGTAAGDALGGTSGGADPTGELPVEAIPVEARPTTAVLIRVRAQIPPLESALRARGLPVDVVGLGGLLDTPEVRDVVSTLRVLADPAEGAALLRLLTGPRWRIGARDLVALYGRARSIAARRPGRAGDAPEPEALMTDRLDEATLAEALDDPGDPSRYSTEGYRRFAAVGTELRSLRRRLDQPLPDLIADIERTIGLDVEVAARPGDAGLARAHLDALGEVAARFANESDAATLTAFLAYLEAAEAEERGLPSGEVEVVEGAVQILTGHAAKGLEWDVVAVAGLCAGIFPGGSKASDHYLGGLGVLPFPLRGDRAGLPELRLSGAADQKAVAAALAGFGTDWRAHDEREERRLAYVAVTRPRRLLLCSGYWWGEGTKRPRGPSPFLEEIRTVCLDGAGVVDLWAAPPEPDETNPTAAGTVSASWPADPLGARRPDLERAADLVRAARARLASGSDGGARLASGAVTATGEEGGWAREVDLLLAERARLRHDPHAPQDVPLADHLSVSQLVALRRDPEALARALRRPLPGRPDPYARRGTAFHAWLERRFGTEQLLDLDELPGAGDEEPAGDEAMDELRRRFEESEWADRRPVRVEVAFSIAIAGVVVRGRMDAVFQDPDGGYDVVDWKTGRRPAPGREADAAAVQLAAYRVAWAELAGVPVDRVRAAFHYVTEGATVRPADLLDLDGLTSLITGLPPAGAEA